MGRLKVTTGTRGNTRSKGPGTRTHAITRGLWTGMVNPLHYLHPIDICIVQWKTARLKVPLISQSTACIKRHWKRLSLCHPEQLHAWRLLGSLGGHRSSRQTGRLQARCRLVYSEKAVDWDLFGSRWTSMFQVSAHESPSTPKQMQTPLWWGACKACCTTFAIAKNNAFILQTGWTLHRGKPLARCWAVRLKLRCSQEKIWK